ncbi:hypothetical protein H9P43_009913 [Blastocladiella emersonii ATCC 22665]|nr:hypothetical protein H9P43_009913 [Blastocladiella emersonii ATCC 22665]
MSNVPAYTFDSSTLGMNVSSSATKPEFKSWYCINGKHMTQFYVVDTPGDGSAQVADLWMRCGTDTPRQFFPNNPRGKTYEGKLQNYEFGVVYDSTSISAIYAGGVLAGIRSSRQQVWDMSLSNRINRIQAWSLASVIVSIRIFGVKAPASTSVPQTPASATSQGPPSATSTNRALPASIATQPTTQPILPERNKGSQLVPGVEFDAEKGDAGDDASDPVTSTSTRTMPTAGAVATETIGATKGSILALEITTVVAGAVAVLALVTVIAAVAKRRYGKRRYIEVNDETA